VEDIMIKKWQQIEEKLKKLPYYTKQNLSLILEKDSFSLDYWLKKLIKEKILIPIKKGVYASSYYVNDIKEKGFFDLYLKKLANFLRQPSYISLETALSYYGLIPEESFNITSITLKSTRFYKSNLATFFYRNIKKELFFGFDEKKAVFFVKIATKAKALFDYLYLKKFNTVKQYELFLKETGRINWFVFNKDDKKEFDQYVKVSQSKKMNQISKIISLVMKNG